MGQIFNEFMEHITWTNYGGAVITILGRDIGFFFIGYVTHLCLEAFIEGMRGKKNENHNRNRANRHNGNDSNLD